MKHFWTKFLASGLLTLNLSACLQTTDGVKNNPASVWKQQSSFSSECPQDMIEFNNAVYIRTTSSSCGMTIYKSSDYKSFTKVYSDTTTDINFFDFYIANGKLFFISAPKSNTENFTYSLYQYNDSTFTKICAMAGNYSKPQLSSPSSIFYAFNNYYYTFINLTNASTDGSGTEYSVYKIDLANKTTSKLCTSSGLVFSIDNKYFSLSTTELKMISFNGTTLTESKTLLSKNELPHGFSTIKRTPTRIVLIGEADEIAVCNRADFVNGNPQWKIHSIKINGEKFSTSVYPKVLNHEETFVFLFGATSSQEELNGAILSTTDFENWTYLKNSGYHNNLGAINWNDYLYSSLLDKFVICGGLVDARDVSKYGGSGVIFTADYTSLSS